MKIVCVRKSKNKLIKVGSIYDAILDNSVSFGNEYWEIHLDGLFIPMPFNYFITLAEYREQRINSIIELE